MTAVADLAKLQRVSQSLRARAIECRPWLSNNELEG